LIFEGDYFENAILDGGNLAKYWGYNRLGGTPAPIGWTRIFDKTGHHSGCIVHHLRSQYFSKISSVNIG